MSNVPGSNILAQALTVIAMQTVLYRQNTGRATTAAGKFIPTYAAAVELRGSFQPIKRSLYQKLGLDLQKNYANLYVSADLIDVGRGVAGDQYVFNGRLWQCESLTPWYAVDGWVGVLSIDVGKAPVIGVASFAQFAQTFSASGTQVSSGAADFEQFAQVFDASGAVVASGSGSFEQFAQGFDSTGTPVSSGIGDFSQPAQTFDATGQQVPGVTIALVGSTTSVSSMGDPSASPSWGAAGQFWFTSSGTNEIRYYTANTGTGAITQNATTSAGGSGNNQVCGLTATRAAAKRGNALGGRTYVAPSTITSSTAGSNTNGTTSLIRVNDTLVINEGSNSGTSGQGVYQDSGSFTLASSNLPGTATPAGSFRVGCCISDGLTAVFSPVTGGYSLATWSGTTSFAQVGNALSISTTATLRPNTATMLSATRMVVYFGGSGAGEFRVYDWDGTDWTQITVTGGAVGLGTEFCSVAALDSTHFVFAYPTGNSLGVYSVT